jgi:hypothetical protein
MTRLVKKSDLGLIMLARLNFQGLEAGFTQPTWTPTRVTVDRFIRFQSFLYTSMDYPNLIKHSLNTNPGFILRKNKLDGSSPNGISQLNHSFWRNRIFTLTQHYLNHWTKNNRPTLHSPVLAKYTHLKSHLKFPYVNVSIQTNVLHR